MGLKILSVYEKVINVTRNNLSKFGHVTQFTKMTMAIDSYGSERKWLLIRLPILILQRITTQQNHYSHGSRFLCQKVN